MQVKASLTLLVLTASTILQAQNTQSAPGAGHHHHHAEATEKLGRVSFPTSCSAQSKAPIERGIALLHSFGYTEARMQFEAIAKSDPQCAMAHWGIAMTGYQELWGQPDADAIKSGDEEISKARALAASSNTTPREKAYVAALSVFFDPASLTFQQRADAYAAKMNELHARFPDDVEAAAFDALAIIASVSPDDTSLTHEHQALSILVPLFIAHPDHPGLAHYIIHTCDTPALAPEGLEAARHYAAIAPSSAHALHMPGHIFARLGLWQEDIASNVASVKASDAAEAAHQPGAAHTMHAQEFLVYAYLQVGEDEKARELSYRMRSISQHMHAMPGMDDMKDDGPFFDNELRATYALEMHDWKTAAALAPAPETNPFESFDTYWGQGIAAGHLHDAALAKSALAGLDRNIEALKTSSMASYSGHLDIKRNELLAWQAFAEDHPGDAVDFMRKAADQQDKLGQMEVDIPAREMLGDLLLMEHKSAEALTEYRVALKLSPNRLNGLLGAGKAAQQADHPDQARAWFKAAAAQTGNAAHSHRAELLEAVKVSSTTQTASALPHPPK